MPEFLIQGHGAKTRRARKRTYRAVDEMTAQQKAEAEGTVVTSVEQLPGPVASPQLIAQAENLGLGLSNTPERLEVVHSIMVQAMHENLILEIQMGTAWDEKMEEVPWRARIRPMTIQRSPQGLRIRCNVEPIGVYLAFAAYQGEGTKLLLLEDIEEVRVL